MNPYFILAFVLALAGAGAGGYMTGHRAGTNAQQVADQAEFDTINAGITAQKAQADKLYREGQATIIALQIERDQFKTNLEKEHAAHQKATDDLRNSYAHVGLRFATGQTSGLGGGGGLSQAAGGNTASATGATVVQLPDETASALRGIAYDADRLADDYRLCYEYVSGPVK